MEAAIFIIGIILMFIGYLPTHLTYRRKFIELESEYTAYLHESYDLGYKTGHKAGWVSGVEMMERKIASPH